MDITFDCDQCGQNIVIDEAGAGLVVACPSCNQALTVPQLKPNPSVSRAMVSTDVHRKPVRNWSVSGFPPDVSLRFSSGMAALYEGITNEETGLRYDPLAHKALDALRQVQANVEVGLTCETYAALIAQASLPVGDFVRMHADEYPNYAEGLRDVLLTHSDTLAVWRSVPTTTTRFGGGGFGIVGFLVGLAMSTGLNAGMDASDAKRNDLLMAALQKCWAVTAAETKMLEDAMDDIGQRLSQQRI